jgi:hypothetical protein
MGGSKSPVSNFREVAANFQATAEDALILFFKPGKLRGSRRYLFSR